MGAKIAIVSTKQPSTNPRMRKNADALTKAGYEVRVFYTYTADWADLADEQIFFNAHWSHQRFGGHPISEPIQYLKTRIIRKLGNVLGLQRMSFCPSHAAYIRSLYQFQPDLVIGHNPGALPILSTWSQTTGGRILFDAEDYHSGEYPEGSKESSAVRKLEDRHMSNFALITAASPLIANKYAGRFKQLKAIPLNNAFERQLQPPFSKGSDGPLKLVWFSQVVGMNRGLQEFLSALRNLKGTKIGITIIGNCTAAIKQQLLRFVLYPEHTLLFLNTMPESELSLTIAKHHIGLALEPGFSSNNLIARSNKLYFYPVCGCFTLLSDTPAQREFIEKHPNMGCVIDLFNVTSIAEKLNYYARNRSELETLRWNSWWIANERLNWETESKVLLDTVKEILS